MFRPRVRTRGCRFNFTPTAGLFRGLAVIFCMEKELRANDLAQQPLESWAEKLLDRKLFS